MAGFSTVLRETHGRHCLSPPPRACVPSHRDVALVEAIEPELLHGAEPAVDLQICPDIAVVQPQGVHLRRQIGPKRAFGCLGGNSPSVAGAVAASAASWEEAVAGASWQQVVCYRLRVEVERHPQQRLSGGRPPQRTYVQLVRHQARTQLALRCRRAAERARSTCCWPGQLAGKPNKSKYFWLRMIILRLAKNLDDYCLGYIGHDP